ncbi:MAG: hypothetical protein KGO49_03305 [Gammaproteobacteria bacterium]|nr:hypothetical protein [Gammaproteobacteria bacterium]
MGFGILLDIILALFIASYANSKGRSFGLWFVISVVLDPLIGFILLQVSSFISNAFTRQVEPEVVQTHPRTIYADELEYDVSSDELYRQSEKLYQQAAKLRELADRAESNSNKRSQKTLPMFR